MSLRASFSAMSSRDTAAIVLADISDAFTFRRVDNGTTSTINGVLTEDSFAVLGIVPEGQSTEDRTATIFISAADAAIAAAGRTPAMPIVGDRFTMTADGITTTWIVKMQSRPDNAGGIHVQVKQEKVTKLAGPGARGAQT